MTFSFELMPSAPDPGKGGFSFEPAQPGFSFEIIDPNAPAEKPRPSGLSSTLANLGMGALDVAKTAVNAALPAPASLALNALGATGFQMGDPEKVIQDAHAGNQLGYETAARILGQDTLDRLIRAGASPVPTTAAKVGLDVLGEKLQPYAQQHEEVFKSNGPGFFDFEFMPENITAGKVRDELARLAPSLIPIGGVASKLQGLGRFAKFAGMAGANAAVSQPAEESAIVQYLKAQGIPEPQATAQAFLGSIAPAAVSGTAMSVGEVFPTSLARTALGKVGTAISGGAIGGGLGALGGGEVRYLEGMGEAPTMAQGLEGALSGGILGAGFGVPEAIGHFAAPAVRGGVDGIPVPAVREGAPLERQFARPDLPPEAQGMPPGSRFSALVDRMNSTLDVVEDLGGQLERAQRRLAKQPSNENRQKIVEGLRAQFEEARAQVEPLVAEYQRLMDLQQQGRPEPGRAIQPPEDIPPMEAQAPASEVPLGPPGDIQDFGLGDALRRVGLEHQRDEVLAVLEARAKAMGTDLEGLAGEQGQHPLEFRYQDEIPLRDEPAIQMPEAAQITERRSNLEERRRVADMSHDELRQALLTDDMTGLGNRRAFEESKPKPFKASVDADGLKWVNDNLGHGVGDALIRKIGEAMRAAGLDKDAFHVSGDEFWAHGESEKHLHDTLSKADLYLRENPIKGKLSTGEEVLLNGGFSYGIGQSIEAAESGLQLHKELRTQGGLRAERGASPPGLRYAESGLPLSGDRRRQVPEPAPRKPAQEVVQPPVFKVPEPARALREYPELAPVDPKANVYEARTADLHTDPRMQYKILDEETGTRRTENSTASGSLRGREYDPELAGVISVWRDPEDGLLKVANGNNRFALAKDAGVETQRVRILEARDAQEARGKAAFENIAEGKGTSIDAAVLFRDLEMRPDDPRLKKLGMTRGKAAEGMALAQLDRQIFGLMVNDPDLVPLGIQIGKANLSSSQQHEVLRMGLDQAGKPLDKGVVDQVIKEVRYASVRAAEDSGALFGADELALADSNIRERAQIASSVAGTLGGEAKRFETLASGRTQEAISKAQGQVSPEQAKALADVARARAEAFELHRYDGPVNDTLNEYATRLQHARSKREAREAVVRQVDEIRGSSGPLNGPDEISLFQAAKRKAAVERVEKALEGKDAAIVQGKYQIRDNKSVITLSAHADETTTFHETAHYVTQTLNKGEMGWAKKLFGDLESEDTNTAKKAHEKLARAMERYYRDGVAPDSVSAGIFEKIRGWFKKVYRTIKGSELDGTRISDEINGFFKTVLGDSKAVIDTEFKLLGGDAAKHITRDMELHQLAAGGPALAKEKVEDIIRWNRSLAGKTRTPDLVAAAKAAGQVAKDTQIPVDPFAGMVGKFVEHVGRWNRVVDSRFGQALRPTDIAVRKWFGVIAEHQSKAKPALDALEALKGNDLVKLAAVMDWESRRAADVEGLTGKRFSYDELQKEHGFSEPMLKAYTELRRYYDSAKGNLKLVANQIVAEHARKWIEARTDLSALGKSDRLKQIEESLKDLNERMDKNQAYVPEIRFGQWMGEVWEGAQHKIRQAWEKQFDARDYQIRKLSYEMKEEGSTDAEIKRAVRDFKKKNPIPEEPRPVAYLHFDDKTDLARQLQHVKAQWDIEHPDTPLDLATLRVPKIVKNEVPSGLIGVDPEFVSHLQQIAELAGGQDAAKLLHEAMPNLVEEEVNRWMAQKKGAVTGGFAGRLMDRAGILGASMDPRRSLASYAHNLGRETATRTVKGEIEQRINEIQNPDLRKYAAEHINHLMTIPHTSEQIASQIKGVAAFWKLGFKPLYAMQQLADRYVREIPMFQMAYAKNKGELSRSMKLAQAIASPYALREYKWGKSKPRTMLENGLLPENVVPAIREFLGPNASDAQVHNTRAVLSQAIKRGEDVHLFDNRVVGDIFGALEDGGYLDGWMKKAIYTGLQKGAYLSAPMESLNRRRTFLTDFLMQHHFNVGDFGEASVARDALGNTRMADAVIHGGIMVDRLHNQQGRKAFSKLEKAAGGFGALALQFKNFAVDYTLGLMNAHDALMHSLQGDIDAGKITKAQARAMAWKPIAKSMGTVMLLGGAFGLPMAQQTVSLVAGAFGHEEQDFLKDMERHATKALGGGEAAKRAVKAAMWGAWNLGGMDIGASFSMGEQFFIDPQATPAEKINAFILGAAGDTAMKGYKAAQAFGNEDYLRGLQNISPDAAKGPIRAATGKVPIVGGEKAQLTPMERVLQVGGIRSSDLTDTYEMGAAQKRLKNAQQDIYAEYANMSAGAQKDLIEATKAGDQAAAQKAQAELQMIREKFREEMLRFNDYSRDIGAFTKYKLTMHGLSNAIRTKSMDVPSNLINRRTNLSMRKALGLPLPSEAP